VILAVAFAGLLGGLAVLQVLLIVGLPFGRFAWGGQNDRLTPRLRIAAGLAIVIYALFVTIALIRLHIIAAPIPDLIIVTAMWVITAYLILSVLPNLGSKSIHEKRLMAPLSAVLAILALLIALI
jgi:small-conductance mechanosensitive channel